jgi:hypothetical protein
MHATHAAIVMRLSHDGGDNCAALHASPTHVSPTTSTLQPYTSSLDHQAPVTTQTSSTTFISLPQHLQSLVLAFGAAPLNTCRAAAAIAGHPSLLYKWLNSRTCQDSNRIWLLSTAAQLQQWGTCFQLLNSSSVPLSPVDIAAALVAAVKAPPSDGQLQLVRALINDHGAWSTWRQINDETEAADEDEQHPLEHAAQAGNTEVCQLLCSQDMGLHDLQSALGTALEQGHTAVAQLLAGRLGAGQGQHISTSPDAHIKQVAVSSDA